MADFETILNDFEIPVPGETEPSETPATEDVNDISDAALEARTERIFGRGGNNGEEQPAEAVKTTRDELPATAQPKPGEGKPNEQEQAKPDTDGFVEASKKAFFGEDGKVDTQKVSDYFLAKGKSFMQFAETAPEHLTEPEATKPAEIVDPEKEYVSKVADLANTLPDILKGEAEKGFTPEQTLQRLQNTLVSFATQRDQRLELAKERERLANEYKGEVSEIRESKLTARIDRNVAELGANLEGLIPGMKGTQVLDKFILSPEYGGKMLDVLFRKDNPNFDKVAEADRPKETKAWFRKFQSDRQSMAIIAEYGRAMWAMNQLPGIIGHAQQVGAQKKANEKEGQQGKPSSLSAAPKGMSSKLGDFFGYDSVN